MMAVDLSQAGLEVEFRRPSQPFPLGLHAAHPANHSASAVNVAVYAPGADALEIHYQRPDGWWEHLLLPDLTDGVHHGVIRGLAANGRYGFRVAAEEGLQHGGSPETVQLLLDPYGRAVDTVQGPDGPVYWSVYAAGGFDWGGVQPPRTHWRDTVVYEAHVKGLTMLHPDIPEHLRGTYAGLAHPVMIDYLRSLGVTAVQLLPVHFHIDEPHLAGTGLTNYWGYNTLGYFAPHTGYATRAAREAGHQAVLDEFKGMVKLLHQAGLEVILDVVYNHTAEGGPGQPALSWRGLGERQYYRHDDGGNYLDLTGCGNTLDFSQPRVVEMALDSLRYWVEEFHIDGFRFDLAAALARDSNHHFDPRHPFLVAAGADQALRGAKLIAEPWDVGMGGWQTGNFPQGWADWNDRFRDTVREFWLSDQAALHDGGHAGSVARLAGCLAGSADVFSRSRRTALSSLNFVTAHDGFTLADLAAYAHKHNEANGEDNRDGHNHNRSYNHGAEGPTRDAGITAAREQTGRNLMATLLLSLGVPMITAGDEFGRTQHGNNNAYCQDNALAWVDWNLDDPARRMLECTRELVKIRRRFLAHQPYSYPVRAESSYLLWFNADGLPMTQEEWLDPRTRVMQVLLGSPEGVLDGLLVVNGTAADVKVALPQALPLREFGVLDAEGHTFELRFATAADLGPRRGEQFGAGESDLVPANSLSVYRA
jgi:glycogen operon protein